jgi:apolipoprotein N-acyltransferase
MRDLPVPQAVLQPVRTPGRLRRRREGQRGTSFLAGATRGPDPENRALPAYLAAAAGGTALAVAWLFPGTSACALLGWIAALFLVYAMRVRRAVLPAYCAGLVGHVVGFYWVFRTVAAFGGFGPLPAALVFALFVVTGSVQFLVLALIHNHLGSSFDALALRSPTAVVLSELLTVRLFPWHFGHTQIAFVPFVQIAGIGGAMAVTFLMFWLAEVVIRVVVLRQRKPAFLVPLAVVGLSLGYGGWVIRAHRDRPEVAQEVVLVQGNATLLEKRDLSSARRYLERLFELSCAAARRGSLVVWPEGAVPAFIPAAVGSVGDPPVLPWKGDGSAFLVGAYAFIPNGQRYNAAFAVYPDGEVPVPYFKQVLIPFGEYMPLASVLPCLGGLNARAGIFSAGTDATVFPYPMRSPDGAAFTLKVSPLICYEDTLPSLARAATRKGAQLLVNITSDSWFGRTVAAAQHHLIAAFRAIENRRFLVRATNTGLSAVVDPLGRTIARIPPFQEGVATATIRPLDDQSAYTAWVGDRPWWALLAVSLISVIRARWLRDPLA